MKTVNEWFDDYGVCHQHPTNKAIHWGCVPLIYFSIIMLLWAGHPWLAILTAILVHTFYFVLSIPLMLGMAVFTTLMLLATASLTYPFWTGITTFVLAWISQFIGHKIEGKKPAFFDDLLFLLIGPLWCLGFLYRKLGIEYQPK